MVEGEWEGEDGFGFRVYGRGVQCTEEAGEGEGSGGEEGKGGAKEHIRAGCITQCDMLFPWSGMDASQSFPSHFKKTSK